MVTGIAAMFRADADRTIASTNNPKLIFPLLAVDGCFCCWGVFAYSGMNGAHRWIRLPGDDAAAFRAGEAGDCAVSGVVAADADSYDRQPEGGRCCRRRFRPLLFIGLILKEPDLGTAMVCAAVLLAMLYLAGMQMKWISIGLACAAPLMVYMLFFVEISVRRA